MKDSTRRALRVFLHGLVAVVIAVPVMAAALPTPTGRIGEVAASVVALCVVVAKVVNALEDAGLIPPILKGGGTSGGGAADSTDEAPVSTG